MALLPPSLGTPRFCGLALNSFRPKTESCESFGVATLIQSVSWAVVKTFLVLLVIFQLIQETGASPSVFAVLDGKTSSRGHISHFREAPSSPHLQLLGEEFHQLEPGLSSYATSPIGAAGSLEELQKLAVEDVVPSKRASIPFIVRPPTGLGQLEGIQLDDLLTVVVESLEGSRFVVDSESVSILDGQHGVLAWPRPNYLKGNLGKRQSETATIVDIDRSFLQVVCAVNNAFVRCQYSDYFRKVQGEDVGFIASALYNLGCGLIEARGQKAGANPRFAL